MLNFKLSLPTEVFFGKGQVKVVGEQVRRHGGGRVLICYGSDRVKRQGIFDAVTAKLIDKGIAWHELGGIAPNPRITSIREGVRLIREHRCDFIVAIGGGSVLDCAKGISAASGYDGDPWDLYTRKGEVKSVLPLGMVLTLAATGSEMNGTSVVTNLETKQKLAIRLPMLKPRFSVLDPVYTYSVPPDQTAAGTVDIMSHVFEQYFSPVPGTFVQDRFADALLKTCLHYGPIALKEPENYEARANLLWAGTLALNELLTYGKTGDWATHMIGHGVAAHYDVTHGVGLAILFPHWMHFVLGDDAQGKFYDLARNVWGVPISMDRMEAAREGIARTRQLFTELGMPARLREVGVAEDMLPAIAKTVVEFGDIGVFRKLNEKMVLEILKKAY